ncbi:MAG: pyridoxamine 5'-phosphate oxidase family protein [Candidatus Levybacteria bacterium]|nr:pyridoxamine 5'-phosphate oxidase family protein [Candidatus Levybacteria bacterium]
MDKFNKRAREIIEQILYITIATASKDGKPWNAPVYSASDKEYNFYWASDQNGQHSQNIADNGHVFLVIYDSTVPEGTGEGVYIKAKAYALTEKTEIAEALGYLYRRKNQDPKKREVKEFLGSYPRRIYKAVPEKVWMNSGGEKNGNFIDIRVEIDLTK